MSPVELTPIGNELAIKWPDEREDFIPLETLRRACPCATCAGEQDALGNLWKGPDRPLGPGAFRLVQSSWVGGYGFQPRWADGHGTGIFSWEYLRRLANPGAKDPVSLG